MILDDIRADIAKNIPTAVLSYGRPFDTALASANISIDDWFIHIDPLTYDGNLNNGESVKLVIGFLKQDAPDSSFDDVENLDVTDSIERLQNDAKVKAVNWLKNFLDNYKYSESNYTILPATRVKNVMSGIVLTVTLSYKLPC